MIKGSYGNPPPDIEHPEQCCYQGCKNRALWYPEVSVWAKGFARNTHPPIVIALSISFCERHKDEFKVSDIPDLEGILKAACTHAGKAAPDVTHSKVTFLPLIVG